MGTERDFKVKKGLRVEDGDITLASDHSVFAGTFNTNVTAARLTLSGTTLAALGDNNDINININPKNNGAVVIDGAVELGHASDTTIARASSGVISVEGSNVIMASNDVSALTDSTSASIGIGTIELGHASDTTIARDSAGVVTIEGAEIRTGTVPVNKGGTGATTLTSGGILLGSGTGAITAMSVLGDGEMIVGDGTTDPVAESGATLRTSIGVGTGDSPAFTNLTLSGDLVVTGDLTVNGATTTISTTNSVVEDSLIELNTGATSNSNDLGFIFERGSTGNNAAIIWDESATKFAMGTTTNTGADTGNLTVATGTLVANIEGNLTGTIQTASQTNITGIGTISTGTWNATDIAVAHGGTGASTESAARTNLGLAIGSDVQAHDAQLDAIAALATTDGGVIIGNGSTFVLESGVTLRNSLNLGISDSPRFTGIELGAPADTTLTRASAGDMNIEGNIVYRAGGTNVAIADGGTNADNVSDARDNLGLTIGTNVQAYDAQLATLAGYTSTQIGFLNVSTAGTVEASKSVVVDANKDIGSFRNLTATGALKSDGMQLTGGANSAADSGTVVAEFDVSEAQVATNSAATIASYEFGTYRTAKFLVQIGRVDSSEQFDCMEILVTYDGGSAPSGDSDIFMTTYGYITTGASDLGTFNAVKGSSTIDLQFTPATSGGTYEYRVVKSLLIK